MAVNTDTFLNIRRQVYAVRIGFFCTGIIYYASALIFLLLLSACSQKIADVKDISITDKDISFKKKVSEVYYPNSGKNYIALAQLINGYLSEEILKLLGHKVDDVVLEAEAKRIDENTKSPEALKKIKDIYGSDRGAYFKTFIKIVYAERALYNEVFLISKEIHKEEYQKTKQLIKDAFKTKKSLREIAKEKGLKAVKLKVHQKSGIIPFAEEDKYIPNANIGIEQAKSLINAISKIREGEVYPEAIEWVEWYQVIRYIKKEGDYYIIESLSIPKRSYDDWFWEKASKIPVRIYDKELKEALLKEVSWADRLNYQ